MTLVPIFSFFITYYDFKISKNQCNKCSKTCKASGNDFVIIFAKLITTPGSDFPILLQSHVSLKENIKEC